VNPDSELEAFKTQIDLRDYAMAAGYVFDPAKSCQTATIMRRNQNKISVRRLADDHFVYYSFRDDHHGSIIDFVQREKGLTLGNVRKELRPWIGAPRPASVFRELRSVSRDFERVHREFAKMKKVSQHIYLEQDRGIPRALLAEFGTSIYRDRLRNAIFPHYDVWPFGCASGGDPCGYEIKNRRFTGFAPGGMKGLWTMFRWSSNIAIVVCESAIDALSHAALFPEGGFLYVSIAGQLSRDQAQMITSLVAQFEPEILDLKVVAATDSDSAGAVLADLVLTAAEVSGRQGLQCYRHAPEKFKDWNEQLLSAQRTVDAAP
jgi:hypothetical protein